MAMTDVTLLAARATDAYVESTRASARLAGGVVEESGGLARIATGSPAAYFNWLYVTGPDVGEDDVAGAVGWFDSRHQPFTVRLHGDQPARYDGVLRGLGFRAELVMPGMVAAPLPVMPTRVDGLDIARVRDRSSYDVFTARVAPGRPGEWLTTQMYRDFMPPAIVDEPSTALFVGELGGVAVSNAAAHLHDGVVTVFAVSTAEDVRRRGIGAAMTAAALAWAGEQGADMAFLTSSPIAEALYRSLGFVEVDTWHFYIRSGDSLPIYAPRANAE